MDWIISGIVNELNIYMRGYWRCVGLTQTGVGCLRNRALWKAFFFRTISDSRAA